MMNTTFENNISNKKLTKAEIRVVLVSIQGLTNSEAAKKLFVEEKTVKFHLTNIYQKLRIKNNKAALLKFCIENGFDFSQSPLPKTVTDVAEVKPNSSNTEVEKLPKGFF